MKHTIKLALVLFALALIPSVANADSFQLKSFNVALNTSGTGLQVQSSPDWSMPSGIFTLSTPGSAYTHNLFGLWTNESTVNSDDLAPQLISVHLDFLLPSTSGDIQGSTVGETAFYGLFQAGHVSWNAPLVLSYGNTGQFKVTLSDADFNFGLFGLGNQGADISAQFELIHPDSRSVPEPASLMLLGSGLLGLLGVKRFRR
jgi:PEP-CTERM motif-containing protein